MSKTINIQMNDVSVLDAMSFIVGVEIAIKTKNLEDYDIIKMLTNSLNLAKNDCIQIIGLLEFNEIYNALYTGITGEAPNKPLLN